MVQQEEKIVKQDVLIHRLFQFVNGNLHNVLSFVHHVSVKMFHQNVR